MADMDAWLKSGEYLPEPLRDFHDQKDVFKLIHDRIDLSGNDYCRDINWIAGQVYAIDIFLWFMAKRGWTLQRSRKALAFNDLAAEVKGNTERRNALFAQMLNGTGESTAKN